MAPADGSSDIDQTGETEAEMKKWDVLLEWMTHLGSGTWEAFRRAVDELASDEDSSAEHVRVRAPHEGGRRHREESERFLRTGVHGYLSKPVNIVELVSVVEEHCRGSGR